MEDHQPQDQQEQAYFVYVGTERHIWRFVHFTWATGGEAAIRSAHAEAVEMGNEPDGSYLAVPFDAITTMTIGEPRFAATEG